MKLSLYPLSIIVALAAGAASRTIHQVTDNTNHLFFNPSCIKDASHQAADLHEVNLPGWSPGPSLFPRNVIAGYNAPIDQYNADSFGQYILEQCKSFAACTTAYSCSAINSGTPKDRAWFGYVFRGGEVTPDDFELAPSEDGVRDVRVYTV